MSYAIAARSRIATVFVATAAVVASLAVVLSTPSDAIAPTQTYAPAQLINESALEAPATVNGSYYPGGMFAATDAERVAVNALEAQAVANTLSDHGLPAGDGPAILSWARPSADANLWSLVLQAVRDVAEGTASSTEQAVNDWLSDSLKRQSILSTQDTGLEYTKWAGLGTATYDSLITNNASLTQLTNFLSTTPNPYTGTGSATNPGGSTDGGYCVYQSPAPDQGDYTGNIFGDDAPQTCFTPCTGLVDCGPPVPAASQFATWGSADYEGASLASFGSSNDLPATAEAASLLATVTTVGSGFVGAGTGALFNGSDLATTFLQAVRPFSMRAYQIGNPSTIFKTPPEGSVSSATSTGETTEEGVEDGLEAADEVGLDAGSTGIGIILTAIIFVITTAIQEGLKIVGAADVPGQIANMIDTARTFTPDPAALAQSDPSSLFAFFINATIPQPSHNSCDNEFVVSSQAALGTPCLNPTAIPAPTTYDPEWSITPNGGSPTTSPTLTLMDSSSGWTPSYRLHGNWIVSTATVSGTTASIQGLTMHYSDWSGEPHTAWVYADHTPTSFITVSDNALGPDFDVDTCQQLGTCAVTSSIEAVSANGTDETVSLTPGAAAPTLPASPCTSGPSCTATTTTVTGATSLNVGDTATFTAAVNADAGVNGTADFTAGTGVTGCTGVALQAPGLGQGGIVTGKVATCSMTFDKAGTYFVFATYNGATTYDPSQGELTINVGGGGGTVASTTTTVTASSNALVIGQPDTFTATIDTQGSGVVPSGTVAFTSSSAGAVTLCAAAVISETAPYTATCPYAFFDWDLVNPVVITASYSGDSATLSSEDQLPITLTPATTHTTVTASTDHPRFGEDVTYTATVTIDAPGGGIPQGGITFSGGATCDSLEVTRTPPFIATCTTSYSIGGTHEVDATYRGDSLTGSSSGSNTVFAGPATSTTTGTPSDTTGHIGLPVTDTAVVTSPIDTPTGFVSFSVCGPLEFTNVGCPSGGTAVGSAVDVDASGSATSDSFTPSHAGVYCFRADFDDDNFDYTSSSDGSSTNCIVVDQLGQTVTFTSSPPSAPEVGGEYVGLAATGGASGNPISFGSITPDVCTVTGTTVSFDATGTCTVQALQEGSEDYSIGITDQSFTVGLTSSQVTVTTPKAAPRVNGQSVTATATVTVAHGTAAGTVQFAVNGTPAGGPVTVGTGGTAVSPLLMGAVGVNGVTAAFTPSDQDTYAGSSGTTSFLLVTGVTRTTLTVRAKNLIARVKAVFPGSGAPTGTVTFSVGGVPVGFAPLVNGVATLPYTTAPASLTKVAAEYSGDAGFDGSSASSASTNPTITAALTSAHAKTAFGWYDSAVTVTFTCTTPGAALTAACPDPVTLSQNGADQTVGRTIYATDGGVASVTVDVNIDETAPTVELDGVPSGSFVGPTPPTGQCIGTDALSGVATCNITVKLFKSGSYTYTATARDRAGNASKVQIQTAPGP